MLAASRGYKCLIAVPSTISKEKEEALKSYGAQLFKCPDLSFTDANHYFHQAKELAGQIKNSFFTN